MVITFLLLVGHRYLGRWHVHGRSHDSVVLFGVQPSRDLALTSVKLSVSLCNIVDGGDMCNFLIDCKACILGRCCIWVHVFPCSYPCTSMYTKFSICEGCALVFHLTTQKRLDPFRRRSWLGAIFKIMGRCLLPGRRLCFCVIVWCSF